MRSGGGGELVARYNITHSRKKISLVRTILVPEYQRPNLPGRDLPGAGVGAKETAFYYSRGGVERNQAGRSGGLSAAAKKSGPGECKGEATFLGKLFIFKARPIKKKG